MAEIIQMSENTWRIEDSFVRCFVLTGEEAALLIDCGVELKNAKELVSKITDLPLSLILTHADGDHLSAIGEFEEFFMNPAEASNFYRNGHTGDFIPVEDGDELDLGNRPLEIISLPGHTPGSIGILDVNNRILFAGDSIQDGEIFMFGVQREIHAYVKSLQKLEDYKELYDEVYPSHGSIPLAADFSDKLIATAEEIIAGKCSGEAMEFYGTPIRKISENGCAFLVDAE